MANEIRTTYPGTVNLYAMIRNSSDEVWYPTGAVFETYGTSSRTAADYAIVMTDQSGGLYTADFDEDISAGTYTTMIYLRNGAAPADVPTDDVIGIAEIKWTGSAPAADAVDETTAAEICNIALHKLGEPRIESIYEGSDASALCLTLYPRIRNEVLQRIGRTSYGDLGAALSGSSLIDAAEWEYQFNLPSDCIVMLYQVDETNHETRYPFQVKRGVLLTNNYSNEDGDSAYIEYIHLEENAGTYYPMQIEAIATLLAAELAPTLRSNNPELRERLLSEYEVDALPQARIEARKEVYIEDEEGDETWLEARES